MGGFSSNFSSVQTPPQKAWAVSHWSRTFFQGGDLWFSFQSLSKLEHWPPVPRFVPSFITYFVFSAVYFSDSLPPSSLTPLHASNHPHHLPLNAFLGGIFLEPLPTGETQTLPVTVMINNPGVCWQPWEGKGAASAARSSQRDAEPPSCSQARALLGFGSREDGNRVCLHFCIRCPFGALWEWEETPLRHI